MSLTVCTGWSPEGYQQYGRQFAESFAKHWPTSVQLLVFGEETVQLPRGNMFALNQIVGWSQFYRKYEEKSAFRGLEPQPGWKTKDFARGYSYRFDMLKFSRQGFIPYAAAHVCRTRYLCWLDADVVTFRDVPEQAITALLPKGKAIAYLGRGEKHPDIAFQLYDLRHKVAFDFLWRFRQLYESGAVTGLKEWHSAYVWKMAAKEVSPQSYLHDLTPNGHGHVWFQSPLRSWMDHLKGDRKSAGRSKERR